MIRSLLSFCLLSVMVHAQAPREVFLEAIHQVENPGNSVHPGRHGELGPYQFKEITWRQHTWAAFNLALNPEVAHTVAIRHYEWLRQRLAGLGVAATDFNLALAWNNGAAAVAAGHVQSYDYATRVTNLCLVKPPWIIVLN